MGTRSGNGQTGRTLPQSMRHQRILDLAAKQPQASMESIAENVPSATVELVERVLEEYGDPAEDATADAIDEDSPDMDREQPPVETIDDEALSADQEPARHDELEEKTADPEREHLHTEASDEEVSEFDLDPPRTADLTDGQRKVLRVVAERPDATQREIADRLDVSAPTVSNRVNAIDGFDWQHRKQAVETFRAQANEPTKTRETMSTNETEPTGKTDRLEARIDSLETQIADDGTTTQQALNLDPELLQKVVHACFKSESISEDEELELLKLFLPNEA